MVCRICFRSQYLQDSRVDLRLGFHFFGILFRFAALPPTCAAGGVNSFNSASTRNQLQCSACLPGSFLVKGACVDACPDDMIVSSDRKSCQGAHLQITDVLAFGLMKVLDSKPLR